MPITIEKRKNGNIAFEFNPKAEFAIGDVARFTGYTKGYLQSADGEAIPASHRNEHNFRVWFAQDVIKIRERKIKKKGG